MLNKKLEFISKCKHENKLTVKSAKKGSFICTLCFIILVFVAKYFVFCF